MERIVYSVDACWDYQGCYPVKLFTSEDSAKECAEKLTEWRGRRPIWNADCDEAEFDLRYDQWYQEQSDLELGVVADSYTVGKITLVDENEC